MAISTISINSTNITETTIVPDTSNSRKTEIYTAPQGYNSFDLNGLSSAFPYLTANQSLAFFFANFTTSDIVIYYLPFANDNMTWQYANVAAGASLPVIMRAVKTVSGTFSQGHKICL